MFDAILTKLGLIRLKEAHRLAEAHDYRKMNCMGVGDGSGKLFVYGDYDSIKAAQALIFRSEEAQRDLIKECVREVLNEEKVSSQIAETERVDRMQRGLAHEFAIEAERRANV
jgi:hypothetical protein